MPDSKKLYLQLEDREWPKEYINHDRQIARAIVFDSEGYFYFVHVSRDDDFGCASYIETAGGGIEPGEDPDSAILRELKEELGADAEIICRIGTVSDYYNLIHRHNINTYYLCMANSFGEKHLTEDEINSYHLTVTRLSFDEALAAYENGRDFPIGRLVYSREVPVLMRAREILESLK